MAKNRFIIFTIKGGNSGQDMKWMIINVQYKTNSVQITLNVATRRRMSVI